MTKSIYRLLLVAFLMTWVSTLSIAQETESINHPITKSGSLAMEFGFGGLSSMSMPGILLADFLFPGEGTPDAIPLYAAGAKYYISDELALRVMLGFSTESSGADTLSTGTTTGTFYGIAAGVEMHTHPVYAISPYFGAQVGFASGSSSTTRSVVAKAGGKSGTLATTTTEMKLSAGGFGVGVVAGFDWYVFNAIAIGCEYDLSFGRVSASSTIDSKTTDEPASTSIGIGSASIHLLIHL